MPSTLHHLLVSQVVLGASKTRRSDFDRRIASEKNKKSTGSWRDNGWVSSVHMPHSMLYEEHERYPTIDIATSRTRQKAECVCSSRPRKLASPWTPLRYSIHLEEKERNILVDACCVGQKHVQKFESSILLRNTSSLRAMPAKPDYKHPECHFVMTESSSGNKNYWESIRLMRQCSSGCRVSPSPKITNLLPHTSAVPSFSPHTRLPLRQITVCTDGYGWSFLWDWYSLLGSVLSAWNWQSNNKTELALPASFKACPQVIPLWSRDFLPKSALSKPSSIQIYSHPKAPLFVLEMKYLWFFLLARSAVHQICLTFEWFAKQVATYMQIMLTNTESSQTYRWYPWVFPQQEVPALLQAGNSPILCNNLLFQRFL